MHLKRIQVPDFRVLKDVALTFEEEFSPKVFPLGSQNGGGKSTLLQLIFALLHCSFTPDRLPALRNTLRSFSLKNTVRKSLAIVGIAHEGQDIELEFFSCTDSYAEQLITEEILDRDDTGSRLKFSTIPELESIQKNISRLSDERSELEKLISELEDIDELEVSEKRFRLEKLSTRLDRIISRGKYRERARTEVGIVRNLQEEATEQLDRVKNTYARLNAESVGLSISASRIIEHLTSKDLIYICNYSSVSDRKEDQALLCHVKNVERKEINLFLKTLSNKVFLAAPSTQVFLFLSRESNKSLFKEQHRNLYSNNYYLRLKEAKSEMPGLFTYDFLDVDILIDAIKSARDKDFREVIEKGEYGSAYKALSNDLSLLFNKKAILSEDFSEITFKPLGDNTDTEFYPEDLSHGELKRLSIYMWLKYRNIEDAIVLMDEIEIALHPDWQYGIVSDLIQWAPTNQYILATHSYELCQALTPAHVKELEPKLLKQPEQSR